MALEVAQMQAALLARLDEELGQSGRDGFAAAAQRLAAEFGGVTAAAVEAAAAGGVGMQADLADHRPEQDRPEHNGRSQDAPPASGSKEAERQELPSLYRQGHMRRRLEQLIETNRRYGHPFGIAVFDAQGPGARPGEDAEAALATVGAALRDSIRIVDEAFLLEEDAICVLAPNLRTVEGVQMAERLLGLLDELERAGGLRISVSAGVVACPDHGDDAELLLHKADAAMWRARAVGQPVGVGALEVLQDR
ncbi:MAG TPA: diguanylate cyclase [Solirubrobacterales bacterium]|nr:diguanylate cyclase [Solirubrobacterales bacterium]